MITTIHTAPAVEPVTVAEAKAHLRIEDEFTADDAYITALLLAAREHVEQITSRKLITQTWTLKLDRWPTADRIKLPFGNLQSVTSVVYLDEDGTSTTWGSAEYIVEPGDPGLVVLADGYTWPVSDLYPVHPIRVLFTCGYGLAVSVPAALKHAIKILVSDYYEHREDIFIESKTASASSLKILDRLIWPYRMGWFS